MRHRSQESVVRETVHRAGYNRLPERLQDDVAVLKVARLNRFFIRFPVMAHSD